MAIGNKNVIVGKLSKGERLDNTELKIIIQCMRDYENRHAHWLEFPCVYECSVCGNWLNKPVHIDFEHYCSRCGAEMVGVKRGVI